MLANLRPDSGAPGDGVRLSAISTDGGASFSAPKPDPVLIDGHCQASMLTVAAGGGGGGGGKNGGSSTVLFANPVSAAT